MTNQTFLILAGSSFEQVGVFSVTTIDSAPAALTLLKKEKFDTIISDYQMPGMNGIQFLVEVRNKFGSVPFILFTGKGREEVVIQAINSGADFYLQKGGEPGAQFAELSHQIKKAVEGNRAEEALRESENTFATIFKSNPISMTLVSATDGVFVDVNDAFTRNTGYCREEVVGKTSGELGIFADNDEQEQLASALQERHFVGGMELHTRTKSGEIRTSQFSSSVIVIGCRPYILSTVEDINGRKNRTRNTPSGEPEAQCPLPTDTTGLIQPYLCPEQLS
ncbi:MAG: response regulator [Methanomicrobiales archaeon]|nr:response regulator [Methanomicrobiales archaeon]